MLERRFLIRQGLGWGVLLWLVGYLLGLILFPIVPTGQIGWYLMPIGFAFTCLVLWKWVRVDELGRAVVLGIVWCAVAILLDYSFIVKLLHPADGYYKLDVYLYYASTFLLPVIAASLRRKTDVAS